MAMVIAIIVSWIHGLFVAMMLYVPFFGSTQMMLHYVMFIPLLFVQWYMNDHNCLFTDFEHWLRDIPHNQTFIGRVIHPVYNINQHDEFDIIVITTLLLWFIALWRFLKRTH